MKLNPSQHEIIVNQQGELAQITAERDQLKQQLAQAQAAIAELTRSVNGCDRDHDLPPLSADFGKGWLSPDEAKALRLALHDIFELASRQKSNRDCAIDEGLIDTAIAAVRVIRKVCDEQKDEAKRLEADAAAMRKALGSAKLRVHEGFDESGSHYSDTCELCRQINKALSTTAGRSLLERLERYEKALEAAKPILKSCFVGPPPDQRKAQDVYEFTREALKGVQCVEPNPTSPQTLNAIADFLMEHGVLKGADAEQCASGIVELIQRHSALKGGEK